MEYKTKIGMEIHVQPKTESKMFCSCANEFQPDQPNKNICEVCTGQPGTLPVINERAVEAIIKAGLALNSEINRKVHWDRKHYFYPDLPKGYQITQNETPLCLGGKLRFEYQDEKGQEQEKEVLINRLHLEEDAGKDMHPGGADYSLIDFNRAGAPLIELVTEPVLENKEQAVAFCKALQRIFRYVEVSDADMEKGQMRCEVNISLGRDGKDGTKVEIKNINSFKGVARSIEYETKRQTKILEEGGKIRQETRGWNADQQRTVAQRGKEEAHDYRYFPEPDLPEVNISEERIAKIKNSLGELPQDKKKRFVDDLGVPGELAEVLVGDMAMAGYFENVCSEIKEWLSHENDEGFELDGKQVNKEEARRKVNQLACNYITTELAPKLVRKGESFKDLKITPENFAELMVMTFKGEINSSATQAVLEEMFARGGDPSEIVKDKDLSLDQDQGALDEAVVQVIADNEGAVADWKAGKERALQFLMGQVMAKMKGKVDPKKAIEMIKEKLS